MDPDAEKLPEITVSALVNAPIQKAWSLFTDPAHVTAWNNASPDWHTPRAENDLQPGGAFNYRMEAKDGSEGFDFAGVYDEVVPGELILYTMDDGRRVRVIFEAEGAQTRVTEVFEIESENSAEMQRSGWQAILDNFKAYTEKTGSPSRAPQAEDDDSGYDTLEKDG